MPIAGNRICGKCGERAPTDEMRYSVDGKRIICAKCQAIEKGGIKAGTTQPTKLKARVPEQDVENKQSEGAVSYYCSNCHYKFSRNQKIDVTSCPYCSKETIHVAPKQSAQGYINNSGKE